MAKIAHISIPVVDCNRVNEQVLATADAETVYWGVANVEPLDSRIGEAMGEEKFWLNGPAPRMVSVPFRFCI